MGGRLQILLSKAVPGPQVISIGKGNNKFFVVEMSSVRERWLTGQAPWSTLAEKKKKNLVTLLPNAFREIFQV